jgi:hypothetical protein
LTNASGYASLDISALTTASSGATTVNAASQVGGDDYTASKSISISASGETDVAEPSAINSSASCRRPGDRHPGCRRQWRSESAT